MSALSIATMVLPASADEGHLVSPDMYDEAEIVEAYDMPAIFTKGVRETYLGSYTIQNYLGAGYMKFTNESFGKDKFPPDKTFRFETNLWTEGTDKDITAGIAYTNWFGDDKYLVTTKIGLEDTKLFTTTKTPGENTKYFGCITNDTNGKMHGTFSIYSVYAE